jgi:CRP-like cAMP-binding protein
MTKDSMGLGDIVVQLKITNRLLAAQLRSTMNQQDLIALLAPLGVSRQDLADILGTTPGYIGVALQRMKKKGKATDVPEAA